MRALRYCVQRQGAGAFEWLTGDPTTREAQERLVVRGEAEWTKAPAKAFDFHDWPTARDAPDEVAASAEAQRVATNAAACIAGARCVRFGDAPAEERVDFNERHKDLAAAAREKHANEHMTREQREAAGIVTQRDRDADMAATLARIRAEAEAEDARLDAIRAAVEAGDTDEALALMTDEERAAMERRRAMRAGQAEASAKAQEERRAAHERQQAARAALAELARRARRGDADARMVLEAHAAKQEKKAAPRPHAKASAADLAAALGVDVPAPADDRETQTITAPDVGEVPAELGYNKGETQ